jgi:hypothetical protein
MKKKNLKIKRQTRNNKKSKRKRKVVKQVLQKNNNNQPQKRKLFLLNNVKSTINKISLESLLSLQYQDSSLLKTTHVQLVTCILLVQLLELRIQTHLAT